MGLKPDLHTNHYTTLKSGANDIESINPQALVIPWHLQHAYSQSMTGECIPITKPSIYAGLANHTQMDLSPQRVRGLIKSLRT